MTTISTQAESAREGARHQDGKFGAQVRADNDIDLGGQNTSDPYGIGRDLTEREKKMEEVAEHLDGYRLVPAEDDTRYSSLVNESENLELSFHPSDGYEYGVPKGKMRVEALGYRRIDTNFVTDNSYIGLSSNVTPTLDPKRIASTLNGLLDRARPKAAEVSIEIDRLEAARAADENAAAQLTERLGGEKDYLGRHAIPVAEYKELRVRGDGKGGIYIDDFPSYHSLSVEQVARIVEIMREGE